MIEGQINPKLSIVAATRNDNHGGDMNKRMQLFIDGLFEQSEKYKFPIEIILVDWNPPDGAAQLAEAICWGKQGPHSVVRVIEVPNSIHRMYKHADKLPLFQMIGKNVGIRRASADFVLATNVDIIFSDEIIEYLAAAKLERNVIYRANRVDVKNQVPTEAGNDEKLRYCKSNVIRIPTRYYTESIVTNRKYYSYEFDTISICERLGLDCLLYTNACGDFQLLSKNKWHELHGYPEFDIYSLHIDSIFEYMAFHSGISEQIIGDIYHMEHDSGYKPEDKINIEDRMKKNGIYCLNYTQYLIFLIHMVQKKISTVFNTNKWGLSEFVLGETIVKDKIIISSNNRSTDLYFNPNDVCDTKYWIKHIKESIISMSVLRGKSFITLLQNMVQSSFSFSDFELPKDFFERLYNDRIDIIAFGSGSYYKEIFLPICEHYKFAPKYIVDNDIKRLGSYVNGIPVKSPDSLMNENKSDVYIVVTSIFYHEIREQLIEMGFAEHLNFIQWRSGYTFFTYLVEYMENKKSHVNMIRD